MIFIAAATLCALAAFGLLFAARWRRTQRILRLDWPDKFQRTRAMRKRCAIYLRSRGWEVETTPASGHYIDVDLFIRSSSHQIALGILLDKDYFGDPSKPYFVNIPGHFINQYARAAERVRAPLALVTDFYLPESVVAECHGRAIYPLHYTDLGRVEELVPPWQQFQRTLAPKPKSR